jgi:hypothetical protein
MKGRSCILCLLVINEKNNVNKTFTGPPVAPQESWSKLVKSLTKVVEPNFNSSIEDKVFCDFCAFWTSIYEINIIPPLDIRSLVTNFLSILDMNF